MKNVNMTISTYGSGYAPAPPLPQQPATPFAPGKIYSVSFSAQFDEEAEAIKFAAELLNKVSGDAS